jgi:hypothetical protein
VRVAHDVPPVAAARNSRDHPTRTRAGAELLTELLLLCGIQCVGLHSGKDQARRMAALGQFRSGLVPVLVATDVASRCLGPAAPPCLTPLAQRS